MITRKVIQIIGMLICYFLFAAPAVAQDGLVVGGKLFRLGMARSEALRLIPSEYQIREVAPETVFITEKREAPYEPVGELRFKKGRVISIARLWVTGKTSSEFAKTLYGALKSMTDDVPQQAKLSTCSHNDPQLGELRWLYIWIGNRTLSVHVGNPTTSVADAIWETIHSKDAGSPRRCPSA